jgi:hypothetical protein
MERLSPLDSAFISFEAEDSPMHVGGLLIFELPARSRPTFCRTLYNSMRKSTEAVYPFNQRVVTQGARLPSWETVDSFDIDQHLFFHQIAAPGGRDQLHELVAGLHQPMLARDRPLWEYHLIGGQLLLERLRLTHHAISLPFRAPDTILNNPLTADRQLATASVPMERVNRIRQAARVSLNQVAISCIDEALHRYLSHLGEPLQRPLVISMPVSLRRRGEATSGQGNQVCMVLVELADNTDDPYIRLRDIGMKLRYVRYQVDELPAAAMMLYTITMSTSAAVLGKVGADSFLSPMSNLVVSNLPGPRETLYLQGAKLLELYPVSAIPPDNQLNITLYSYDQGLHFGLVATRKLKNLSKLGAYIYEAFENLESAVLDPLQQHQVTTT